MEQTEREVLPRWKKRRDSLILIRLKAEAILHAPGGVDLDFIAEMVGRTRKTVQGNCSGTYWSSLGCLGGVGT
jgi:hypothetical protein